MSSAAFVRDAAHEVFRFISLAKEQKLLHVVTTRNSFFIDRFNLSFHTGQQEEVINHRGALLDFFKGEGLIIPRQCHGSHVVEITADNRHEIPHDTDALITRLPNQVIGVLAADCVPVLLYDPVQRALGAAHAGWKGTVAEIATKTLTAMSRAYGSKPEHILACIGPSISAKHFEVGEEVRVQFEALQLNACIIDTPGAKAHVDLWLANRLLLQRAGVKEEHISTAEVCTYEGIDNFYSARREGFETGRFGIFAMLES